ncbi:hypothetical protein WN55_07575 [Dufourea novaeangliae]|uniref:Uncharacterized protein n=1 Tax=Dufourea novaeangliae TaxID=178035 RepID=A0A154P2R0_DUFNO|nr:hypothetical protein WN55_07575 [Dufourea novaeangliae]
MVSQTGHLNPPQGNPSEAQEEPGYTEGTGRANLKTSSSKKHRGESEKVENPHGQRGTHERKLDDLVRVKEHGGAIAPTEYFTDQVRDATNNGHSDIEYKREPRLGKNWPSQTCLMIIKVAAVAPLRSRETPLLQLAAICALISRYTVHGLSWLGFLRREWKDVAGGMGGEGNAMTKQKRWKRNWLEGEVWVEEKGLKLKRENRYNSHGWVSGDGEGEQSTSRSSTFHASPTST